MLENPSMADGFSKESRLVIKDFWTKLSEELNSAGPPVKSVVEWKKVWIDQKRYARLKAAKSSMKRHSAERERTMYKLLQLDDSTECIENDSHLEENSLQYFQIKEEPVDLNCDLSNNLSNHSTAEKRMPMEEDGLTGAEEFIDIEVPVQQNIFKKIGGLKELVDENNSESKTMLKIMCRSLELMNDIQKDKLKERHRHNKVMEEYRRREVESQLETNKKLIEIEEQKLQLMLDKK